MKYIEGKRWRVRQVGCSIDLHRPNRTAAGMSETAERSGNGLALSEDALRLSVRGTLDALSGLRPYYARAAACTCCGAKNKGPIRLTDAGRSMLRRAKRERKN